MKPRLFSSYRPNRLNARIEWCSGLACFIALTQMSGAAVVTWTGGGGVGRTGWTQKQNWGNTTVVSGDTLQFGGTVEPANTNDFTNATFAGITFLSGAGAFTLSGNAFTLSGDITNNSANIQTVNIPITLSGARIFNASTGGLVFGGTIANGGNLLTLSGASTISISGIVSGTGGLTTSGAGTRTLSGTNTYTGVTTLSGGVLSVATIGNGGVAGNLGQATNAASNLVFNGGTLRYTGTAASTDRNFTLTAATTGTIDVTNSLTMSGASTATTGALTKSGAGTLILTGANLHTGATTITTGTLQIGSAGTTGSLSASSAITNNAALSFNRTNTITQGTDFGTISGTGSLTQAGSGTLVLSSNNTYTGATVLSSGTLRATTNASALGAGALTMSGGALQLANDTGLAFGRNTTVSANTSLTSDRLTSGAGVTHTLGTLSIGAQTLTLAAGTNVASGTAGLTFGATTLSATGATFSVGTGTQLTLGAVSGSGNSFTVDGAGSTSITGAITTGTGGITKSGTGVLALGGANTYTGNTTISGGTLQLATGGIFGSGSNIVVASNGGAGSSAILDLNGNSATIGSLTIGGVATGGPSSHQVQTGAGTLTLGGNVTVNGTTTYNTAAPTTISGNLALGGATRTFSIADTNLTTDLTISAAISGTGTGITKTGAGLLSLTGSNTYTGTTTVGGGILSIGSANALAGGGNVTFGGGSLQYTANNTSDLSGRITSSGSSIAIDTNGQNVTWASNLASSNTGGLTKSGTGSLTLSGNNAYTGTTSVLGGSLNISSASNLSNAGITLNGGTLRSTSGTYSLGTGRSITLGGAGAIQSDAGTLTVGGAIANGGNLLTIDGSGNTSLSGIISGSGGLTKNGSGTLVLDAANTFTGAIAINSGVVNVRNNNGLGADNSGAATVASGAALELQGGISVNVPVTLNGTGIGNAGALRNISGTNTMAGIFTLGSATRINSDADLLTISNIISGSGTDLTIGGAGGTTLGSLDIGTSSDLTKDGAGALTLDGPSNHANTTVNSGRLNINDSEALGSSAGALTLASGVTLGNTSGADVAVQAPKSISLGSSLTYDSTKHLDLGTGTTSLSANTTITVNSTGKLQFGGNVTGAFGLTKEGTGTLEFSNLAGSGSSFTGIINVNAGLLLLSGSSSFNANTINLNTGGTLTLQAGTSLGDGTTLVYNGGTFNGAATPTGASIEYSAEQTMGTSSLSSNGMHTIKSEVTLIATDDYFGTNPASPTNRIRIENNGVLKAASSFTINANKNLVIGNGAAATATMNVDASQILTVASEISGSGSKLVKTGSGELALTGTNTYSGGTEVRGGTLVASSNSSTGTGDILLSNATLEGSATFNLSRNVSIEAAATGSLTVRSGETLTYSGAGITGSGSNLYVGSDAHQGTLVMGGSNSYTGSTTIHAGTLEVSTLANGSQSSSLGASASDAGNLVLHGGTLKFTGSSAGSTDRLFSLGTMGGTINASGSATLNLSNSGSMGFAGESGVRDLALTGSTNGSLAAAIGDNGGATSIYKRGGGTWTLSGTNTYTGNTTLEAGTLQISSNANLGSGDLVFASGSTGVLATSGDLSMSRAVTLTGNASIQTASATAATLSGVLSGAGSLTKSGSGTLELTGASNTMSGGVTISGGTLKATGLNSLGSGAVTNNGALDLSYDSTATAYLLSNTITGSGTLSRNYSGGGTSTVALTGSGDNTFSGLTTVNGGTLRLDKSGGAQAIGGDVQINGGAMVIRASEQVSNLSALTLSGGTFEFAPTIAPGRTETIASLTQSGGAFRTNGNTLVTGNFSLSGSGATTSINGQASTAGTLQVDTAISFTGSGDTTLTVGDAVSGATGSKLQLNGNLSSSLTAGTATIANGGGNGIINLASGGHSFDIGNGSADIDMLISAGITGSGSLTKSGAGMLKLTGSNTYTGPTSVSAGILSVNGSLASDVSVANGAVLKGSGSISGSTDLASGATLAPGNSPGVLEVTDLNFNSGSIFDWELDTTQSGRGVQYDAVNVAGNLTGGNAIFKIILTGTQSFSDTFWYSSHSWTDIFTGADGTTPFSGWTSQFSSFQFSYNGQTSVPTRGTFQFEADGTTLSYIAVPETGNIAACLLVAAGLTLRRRPASGREEATVAAIQS